MDTMVIMKGLQELAHKFDEGCQITVSDESIMVEGSDWYLSHPEMNHVRVVRNYEVFFGVDDHDEPVDVIARLIENIDQDRKCLSADETKQATEAPERRVQESLRTGID